MALGGGARLFLASGATGGGNGSKGGEVGGNITSVPSGGLFEGGGGESSGDVGRDFSASVAPGGVGFVASTSGPCSLPSMLALDFGAKHAPSHSCHTSKSPLLSAANIISSSGLLPTGKIIWNEKFLPEVVLSTMLRVASLMFTCPFKTFVLIEMD